MLCIVGMFRRERKLMNRKVIIGVLALPVLALLVLAMVWLDGAIVRARLANLDKQLGARLPLFTVVHRQVSAGLFSSTVEVTYGFNTALFKGMATATASAKKTSLDTDTPPQFTLRHRIQHGPLPGFAGLGLARIDTGIVMSEAARQHLRGRIGTDQPLTIVTLLGYTGGGTTTLDSPAFTYNDAGHGGRIEWRGMNGRVNFGRGMNSQEGELTILGLKATGGKGNDVTLGTVRFGYDLKRVFGVLYAGRMNFTLDRLSVAAPAQATTGALEMQMLDYQVQSSATGEFLDTVAKIGLGSLTAASFKASEVHYDFSMLHVHGPTYAALTEKLREVYLTSFKGDPKAAAKILEPFKEYGATLLEHQPEFIIDRVAMRMPEGAAQLSGKVTLPGYAHGDLDAGPMALLAKIDATLDVAVDEGLLNRNWGSPAATPAGVQLMQTKVAAFEQQGLVTRKGATLSSHLEFRHGALMVNGKPMGPGAAGGVH
jgi:uncharacterized protein YdgA (DUF945 family)